MADLTKEQRFALEVAASGGRYRSAPQLYTTPAQCGGLVRRGLLTAMTQSEQVRGERRLSYQLYAITDAGRAALATPKPTRG